MYLEVGDYAIIIVINAAVSGLLLFVVKTFISARVKFEHDKMLEKLKEDARKRDDAEKEDRRKKEQSVKIAELISLLYTGNPSGSNIQKINQLYWELSLYLPSASIRTLNKVLNTKDIQGDPLEAVLCARKLIVGKNDDVKIDEILVFRQVDPNK